MKHKDRKNPSAYAVCPLCDNPIQLVGLFKETLEAGRKPYGRHHKGSISTLAEYSEDHYFSCPYSNPSWSKQKSKRLRNPERAARFKKQLLEQFDRAIYVLQQELPIYTSFRTAQRMLEWYMDDEAWDYYDSREDNLPWMLAYTQPGLDLYGRLIRTDSKLYRAIKEKCPEAALEPVEKAGWGTTGDYAKITSATRSFLELGYCFYGHEFRKGENEEHLDEVITLNVFVGRPPDTKDIFTETYLIDPNKFIYTCQKSEDELPRNQKLLDMAKTIITGS